MKNNFKKIGYTWVPSTSHSGIPNNAVQSGFDIDGAPIYVGRAHHEGNQITAKVIPTKNVAYVAYGGQEIPKHQFDVKINSKKFTTRKEERKVNNILILKIGALRNWIHMGC